MIALFCKANAVQTIWHTYEHVFALLLNTLHNVHQPVL